jgi:hypothetical protein
MSVRPLSVTEIDGNRLYYQVVDQGIYLGSLELEPNYSIVPSGFTKDQHGGYYGVTYCSVHHVALHIQELDAKQCQLSKS